MTWKGTRPAPRPERPVPAGSPLGTRTWRPPTATARNGQVFIAATPYRNDAELEFALASYLLVVHHQGRLVFQPMPMDAQGTTQES